MTMILMVIFLLFGLASSHAQTRGEWFKSLMRPNGGSSCCDAADCKRVDAHWVHGSWWILVPGEATEREVPNDVILNYTTSIDGEAYACIYFNSILCFVPPDPGT